MANHCIDLICLGCGAFWCARGCGTDCGPDAARLARYIAESQRWADKFNGGKISHVISNGDRCSHCGTQNVAIK